MDAELRATAPWRSARPTSEGSVALAAGALIAAPMPMANTMANEDGLVGIRLAGDHGQGKGQHGLQCGDATPSGPGG